MTEFIYLRSRAIRIVQEKKVFFKGKFREHRRAAFITCVMESGQQYIKEWLSEDGLQFVFKSYG